MHSRPRWGGSLDSGSFVSHDLPFFNVPHAGYLIAGIVGATPLAVGAGSVADLFSERDRASAMAMWVLTPPFHTSADRIGVGILSDLCWVRLLALLQEGKRPAGLLRVLEPNGFSSFVVQTIGYKYVFISTLPTIYLPHEANFV